MTPSKPAAKQEITKEALLDGLAGAKDIIKQTLQRGDQKVELVYIKYLCDETVAHDKLITPFYDDSVYANYSDYIASLPIRVVPKDLNAAVTNVVEGFAALFIGDDVFILDVMKLYTSQAREASVETVIQGPQYAFSEAVGTNVNLLRRRYGQPSLEFETTTVGTKSRTTVAIMYDEELVDRKVLEHIKQRLSDIRMPVVQAAGQLSQLIENRKRTLFPRLLVTERPDRAALNLAQGKVVLLLEGTPFAVVAPATFYDFIASMEDIYQTYFVSRFLMVLRYAALLVSLTLPALYVGFAAYNPEVLRVQLAMSIAGSRYAVPYPAFIEVLFMLLAMELLVEASVRLPKMIGSTATTVGGLILGQAATEAGLVSNIMIIIVATVAISNFVIPINAMSFAIRVSKYVLLAFATLYGLIGIVLGLVVIIGYLVSLETFGQPFLKLYENDDRDVKSTQRQPQPAPKSS
ncbi:spore germination protein [Paenibacillus sp. TRM 82003]|nr:spore germination protein [Paenibacillus sp. TRM 82003]